MKVIKKDSYPKGTNVFCNDAFHMGQSFGWSPNATQEERVKTKEEAYAGHGCFNAPAGSRIVVMMSNHENADCPGHPQLRGGQIHQLQARGQDGQGRCPGHYCG